MKIDILTLFPEVFKYFDSSIIKKAKEKSIIDIKLHDIRDYSLDKHSQVDDKPYGGGSGMVLQIEPIYRCLKSIGVYPVRTDKTKVILTQAGGLMWKQSLAKKFSESYEHLVIICGHYQGVDARITENFIDFEISIGEYVLTGGELPSMVIVDSVVRLLPSVLGNPESILGESYSNDIGKSAPLYTRPKTFITEEGVEMKVPQVLIEGNHKKISQWIESSRTFVQDMDTKDLTPG
jgi:tRNA (guanine37-N1)-methyltransferase